MKRCVVTIQKIIGVSGNACKDRTLAKAQLNQFYNCFLKQSEPPNGQNANTKFKTIQQKIPIDRYNYDISNDILNGKIQLDEVEKVLGRIRKGEASGIDGILSYILRTINISHLYWQHYSIPFSIRRIIQFTKRVISQIHRTIGKFLWFPLLQKFLNLYSKIDCHSKT